MYHQDNNNNNNNNNNRQDAPKRRRVCHFCQNKEAKINYKDVPILKRFIGESGKISPRRFTGACSMHQRALSLSIKRARFIALIPYLDKHRPDYQHD